MKDEDHPKQDSGTKDNGWGGGRRNDGKGWGTIERNRRQRGEREREMHTCTCVF